MILGVDVQPATINEASHVSLAAFLTTCGILGSIITALLGWVLAASVIPDKVAERVEQRIAHRIELEKAVAKEIHDRLDAGIDATWEAIGKLSIRLDGFIDKAGRTTRGDS